MRNRWHGGKGPDRRKTQVSKERDDLGWELLRKGLTETERLNILNRLEQLKLESLK